MASSHHVRFAAAAALLFPLLMAGACASMATRSSPAHPTGVIDVARSEYRGSTGHPLEEACRNWQLSPAQVLAFFRLADSHEAGLYNRFYQVDCSISGHLRAEGRIWRFAINGGGIATLKDGDTIRHFGCSATECESLLLLPSDGMQPD